ncbi:MAG: 1-deoxy-D-xylulose-5-phosphate synthase [Frisingicoccus sp.]|uniref:1-deoxy-D-xylulose-5-phosphate synthase n=1 Tax=Frisingicoccus sp. TaxID=1918627 RepID=UPI00261641A7|nr:1-deoxy-D-xylulose-5-phosphate synthase [Frisingicoccus sp.]MDD6233342.1 1-deoxy-D-xylulose-5-phosphate synthase [Frisingicoccus sp.]MDY4836049.1 1-deoxy-D-xylulose-5-phosphate synthase [Frisingicoccus sp.]
MAGILEQIKGANDIKAVSPSKYDELAQELREFIIHSVSETGGHLASNLGVVELTMALHLCLDLPKDKIIWDVGHQSYTHKILTGRKDEFAGLRSFGGMSGFPKHRESQCDAFDTGHSSTSISAALGYVRAREIKGEDYTVVAVIGDGSMTGGMAYEALNNAARLNSNLIIILNDNKMSISENVGGMSKYLNRIRTNESYVELKSDVETALRKIPGIGDSVAKGVKKSKDSLKQLLIPGGFFEDLGIEYMGPVDGHNMTQLLRVIKTAKKEKRAVLVHVITQKGRGYKPAEVNPSEFHGVGKFDIESGHISKSPNMTYTEAFSKAMLYIGTKDERVVAVSAAMPSGTGLVKFSKRFPKRFFDVGIAEEHAVTFSGGLAAAGLKPYVAIYSSFFQRAYDQIIHDVCIPDLPVVFCIDRAGIVGADGETHQGILDLSFFSSIPGMTVFAPKNKFELYDIMKFSLDFEHPLAIRYPRGDAYEGEQHHRAPIVYGKSELLYEGEQVALVAVGSMVETAIEVKDQLAEAGLHATVVNARFVKPLDTDMLDDLCEKHNMIVTLEENVLRGGFGEAVSDYYMTKGSPVCVRHVGIPDVYVEHGNVARLKQSIGMDAWAISSKILSEVLI